VEIYSVLSDKLPRTDMAFLLQFHRREFLKRTHKARLHLCKYVYITV